MAVFRELLPAASRVVVLYNPENVSKPPEAARTVELAKELGLGAKRFSSARPRHRARVFPFAADRPDGLPCLRSSARCFMPSFRPSCRAGSGSRLCIPSAKASEGAVDLLRSAPTRDGVDRYGLCREDAEGSKTRRMPVEQPTRFELLINLKTAKEIRLTIPPRSSPAPTRSLSEVAGATRG